MSLTIGISKSSGSEKYKRYAAWLHHDGEDVETIDLSTSTDVEADMSRVDALLLTGGSDIDPNRYHHPEAESVCADIDYERDALEFRLLGIAEERDLPVLAICRGLQVLNVHHGGTLIPHLPDVLQGREHHQKDGDKDRMHEVEVVPGTLLYKVVGDVSGEVNTAHHQAIGELGHGLAISARAVDGVIEAVEWANPSGKPYLLGVQWHPERMPDLSSPFSSSILEQFLFEAKSSQILARSTRPLPKSNPEITPEEAPPSNSDPLLPIIP